MTGKNAEVLDISTHWYLDVKGAFEGWFLIDERVSNQQIIWRIGGHWSIIEGRVGNQQIICRISGHWSICEGQVGNQQII